MKRGLGAIMSLGRQKVTALLASVFIGRLRHHVPTKTLQLHPHILLNSWVMSDGCEHLHDVIQSPLEVLTFLSLAEVAD